MERYDEGLRIIASAQEARDAGDHNTAHAKFLQGIEELMKLVQNESDEKTKALVRKHVARFMDEAELLAATPSPKAKLQLAKAQEFETRARKAQSDLRFVSGLALYTEAGEAYKMLRQ